MTPNIAERVERIRKEMHAKFHINGERFNEDSVHVAEIDCNFLLKLLDKYQKLVEECDYLMTKIGYHTVKLDWTDAKKESGLFEEKKE